MYGSVFFNFRITFNQISQFYYTSFAPRPLFDFFVQSKCLILFYADAKSGYDGCDVVSVIPDSFRTPCRPFLSHHPMTTKVGGPYQASLSMFVLHQLFGDCINPDWVLNCIAIRTRILNSHFFPGGCPRGFTTTPQHFLSHTPMKPWQRGFLITRTLRSSVDCGLVIKISPPLHLLSMYPPKGHLVVSMSCVHGRECLGNGRKISIMVKYSVKLLSRGILLKRSPSQNMMNMIFRNAKPPDTQSNLKIYVVFTNTSTTLYFSLYFQDFLNFKTTAYFSHPKIKYSPEFTGR